MNDIVRSDQVIKSTRGALNATSVAEQHQAPPVLENDPEFFFKACNPRGLQLSSAAELPVNAPNYPYEPNGKI
jgi:hypothetical protein